MIDEEKNVSQETKTSESGTVDNTDYIAAIKELKQNTVSKADYEALAAEKKKLVEALKEGTTPVEEQQEQHEPLSDIAKRMQSGDLKNLDYVKDALKYREQAIKEGLPDPFVPLGHQISPTDEDIATANKVATALQNCVDIADGDSAIFTNELQRRLIDIRY